MQLLQVVVYLEVLLEESEMMLGRELKLVILLLLLELLNFLL